MISFSFKFTFLIIVSLFSSVTLAAVWSSENQWDEKTEMEFSRWINEDLSANVFADPTSAYYGIKTDCADAVLVVRAIYSFENKLPFSFFNIDGVMLSNQTMKYDHIEQERRVISFLNDLGDQISAESLALKNTFSIHPKDIRPGDFYIVKWTNSKGQENRHAYLIKDILPTGNLVLLSSTTPKAKRVLATRQGMPVQLFSSAPFGFRRFKERASKVVISEDLIQYTWVKFGENEFYTRVKNLLKTEEDSYQKNFERRFANVCIGLDVRREVVEEAIRLKGERNGRCFSSAEYDEYSTPSRDHNLLMELERIKNAWLTITQKKIPHDLSSEEVQGLDFFIGKDRGPEAKSALSKRCVVSFSKSNGDSVNMNLKYFFERLSAGTVSSNPNDAIEARYGLLPSRNNCH